jgi:hypothetical protein
MRPPKFLASIFSWAQQSAVGERRPAVLGDGARIVNLFTFNIAAYAAIMMRGVCAPTLLRNAELC